jgi:hypothetical protein
LVTGIEITNNEDGKINTGTFVEEMVIQNSQA